MRDDWQRLDLIGPVVTDKDSFLLHVDALHRMSLLQRVLDNLGKDFFVEGVGDVEHVLSIALPAFWVLVREVLRHILKLDQILVEMLDGQLIKLDHLDELDFLKLHELLITLEHLLRKIPGEHLVGWHIVLKKF